MKFELFIFFRKEDERGKKTYGRAEKKQNAELAYKVGNERLSCLFVKGKGYSVICNEMVEKVIYRKYHCRN